MTDLIDEEHTDHIYERGIFLQLTLSCISYFSQIDLLS